ncbi:MAG: phosphodiester glycosidase family protein [Clostridiales bacterium]|nr:phosphodiester glycosidase family protein [Clostridiales bacterium]
MKRHGSQRKNNSRRSRRRQRPVWALIILHILALGAALLVYALFHHVIPRTSEAVGIVSTRMTASGAGVQDFETEVLSEPDGDGEAEPLEWALDLEEAAEFDEDEYIQPEETAMAAVQPSVSPEASPEATMVLATPEPTPVPTEEPKDDVGSFRIKFADKFATGKTKKTSTRYKSKNLNIKISKVKDTDLDAVYYVVDIYVADISCFRTCFAQGKYGTGYTAWPLETTRKYNAIITMNGDYYGVRKSGVVIRNGKLYRNGKVTNDVCVLYWDGTMKTFAPGSFDAETEMKNGAYQAWNFGPALLDSNGKAKTKFNSQVTGPNPRSVIGYFEPGHYCFVAVDGRTEESDGLSMKNLAKVMEKLGCKQAYNLDGGRTTMLYAGDTRINVPVEGGRKSSDFVMILDKVTK